MLTSIESNDIKNNAIFKYSYFVLLLFIILSGFSISISQIALGISIILFVIGFFKSRQTFAYQNSGLERYIAVFIIISFALAFLSPNIIKNLNYIKDFWLVSAFLLGFMLHESKDDIIRTLKVIISVVLIQSILALIQFYFKINFADAVYYGLIRGLPYKYYNQWRGSFLGMHLVFSCYMVFISLPLVYISFIGRNNLGRVMISSIRLSSILAIIVLFITQTKSIMVALSFAIIPLIKKKKLVTLLLILPIVIYAIFALSFNVRKKSITDNLEKKFFKANSSRIRINIWKTAFRIWENHPIIGSGGGNYLDEFKKITKAHPEDKPVIIAHAHNDYLNQLARKGIIGFVAFIYMLYGIFRFYWKNMGKILDSSLKLFFMGLFGSFCVFLIASLFQCFFTDEENLVMFWFTIGLAAAIVKIEKAKVENDLSADQ